MRVSNMMSHPASGKFSFVVRVKFHGKFEDIVVRARNEQQAIRKARRFTV